MTEEIIKALDLKTVVKKYAGSEFYGNRCKCPLHDGDSFNSFAVYNSGKRFKCFSCGAYGDVIEFTELFFKIPFYQAREKLVYDFALDPEKLRSRDPTESEKKTLQKEIAGDLIRGYSALYREVYKAGDLARASEIEKTIESIQYELENIY